MPSSSTTVEAVKSGELLFDIGGHWLQGGFALVTLFDQIKGIPVPPGADNVKLKLLPLTKDRVAQFEKDFPGGVPAYDFRQHSRFYNKDAKPAVFEMQYSN
ncbi:hypothetical protein EOA27_02050 [Mesorhizobium sp. M2A.F.Ca.ET.037.01.1.1]|uniref:hypothetical protein n=1 Tax=unclassified Mesorhizobium TaxID=325217 RepID=UPI000FCA4CFE|nr:MULTISPECIES: hypothetical protein [unclassified Mesorhizobium]RVC82163.1 hypothetical protein EN766_01650 [Mesorhizobium sp. M2A.F.Ca.ET.046.02.1.1]RUX22936.1 hypothetical protein EOA27_02050 [Mesorhizobium sp. M2A.F.Ca.ET.037.01.1.1]RWE19986.1 MAG: hypothetical protein EOS76_09870 [Mesorhizobium sp.]RWF00395.1 MAG: hypothetical protein EOS81_10075 [Mesorhizobium sp.]RWX71843.1 hypothetical protein EOA24_04525 [Mesorhizobium sp. M2A.F.Ca.ET.039.01.1.1]